MKMEYSSPNIEEDVDIKHRSKKVAIFSTNYYPSVGGVEKVVRGLACHLAQSGYSVDVITCDMRGSPSYECKDGVEIYRIPSWDLFGCGYVCPNIFSKQMRAIVDLLNKDCSYIITNTRFYPLSFIGWVLSRWHTIPLIHLEHGSRHTVSDNFWVSFIGKCYDHSIGSLLVRSAKMNFGVSAAAVEFLRHIGARKAKIMHNGIDILPFERVRPLDSMKKPGCVVITYIGRLIYAKGVHDLLSIVPKLKGNAQLFIVGTGPYMKDLEIYTSQLQGNNVIFVGAKDPEDIPVILKSSDIFVNPSYSEGLPTSVLEACAAGCAVVATDVGGTNEIIHDGSTGFLVHPGDRQELTEKINLLIENKALRETLGRNAKAYIMDNFSWDQIIGQWMIEMKHLESGVVYAQNKLAEVKSNV